MMTALGVHYLHKGRRRTEAKLDLTETCRDSSPRLGSETYRPNDPATLSTGRATGNRTARTQGHASSVATGSTAARASSKHRPAARIASAAWSDGVISAFDAAKATRRPAPPS